MALRSRGLRSQTIQEQYSSEKVKSRTSERSPRKGRWRCCLWTSVVLLVLYMIPPLVIRYSSWTQQALIYVHHVKIPYYGNVSIRCGRWCVHVYTLEHACILVSFPTRALRLPLNYRNAEMKNAWEGSAMPRSVLTLECCHVLMRERTSVQPISVQVRLMTGSKHTVEHRNFE